MKKFSIIFVIVICFALCVFGCSACGSNDEPQTVTYTVTFETGTETKMEPIMVSSGKTIEKPTDPIKPSSDSQDFSFNGWYYGNELWDFANDVVVSDMVLVAHYQSSTIQCVINFYNEDKTTLIETKTVDIGSNVSINDPVKQSTATEEYTFSKWLNLSDDSLANFENVRTSFDVYAVYESSPKTYQVTFYDSDKTTVLDLQRVASGASITTITPNKASDVQFNYTFDKWLTIKNNTLGVFSNIAEDMEVYATYTETLRRYNITWLSDGVSIEIDTDVEYGSTVTYNGVEPDKDGYCFAGWFESQETANKAQTEYRNALDISNIEVLGEKTYYAGFAKVEVICLSKPLYREYGLGEQVSLPEATLSFLGQDISDGCEWQVKKDNKNIDLLGSNVFTMTEAGTYNVNIVRNGKVLVNYNIKSTISPVFASGDDENTVITYNDGEAETWTKGALGLNISAGDTVTINRTFTLDKVKMAEKALVVNPDDGAVSKGYYLLTLGLDDLTQAEYKQKDFTLTIYDADDSTKYITIKFAVDANGYLTSKTSYCGGVEYKHKFSGVTPGKSQKGEPISYLGSCIACIYAEVDGIALKSYTYRDKNLQIFNSEIFSGFEMFDSFTFTVSTTTGNDVDIIHINNNRSNDGFYQEPKTAVTLLNPLLAEYVVNTQMTLPNFELIVNGEDVSEFANWKVVCNEQQVDVNEGKVLLNQTGEYQLIVVSGVTVIESYAINVVEDVAYATASSANTVITYNDTTFEGDNCLGVTLAAGDSITINKIFALDSNLPENAGSTAHRLLYFSLDDWTLDQYQGKELLITITSAKDSSKFFTLSVTVLSTGQIVICVKNGGVATSSSYDLRVATISYASGKVPGASHEMCQIYMGQNGLSFTKLRWEAAAYDIDNFATDFSEYVVSMSSTTGFEIDFARINYDTAWS